MAFIAYYNWAGQEYNLPGFFSLYIDIERAAKQSIFELAQSIAESTVEFGTLCSVAQLLNPLFTRELVYQLHKKEETAIEFRVLIYGILVQLVSDPDCIKDEDPEEEFESPDWNTMVAQATIYFGITREDALNMTIEDFRKTMEIYEQYNGVEKEIDPEELRKDPQLNELLEKVRQRNNQNGV